ncbi:MAG: enoyl-CoA hydratase/isomerase family protein [Xanthomonadales bacterium]|nr:enoyl-CoA hydratase/isomerase family protein [Xanthomonadales bacterium]
MLEIIDHHSVREIRLARPPANALNPELMTALTAALQEAANVADAVIVSGLPGMFSAGLDVPELLQLDREALSRAWQGFLEVSGTIARMPVPTAFALTGHAPAAGIVMALFGDYRVMASGFKTGLNEVQVGLVVPSTIYQALVRAVGPHTAERILVAGEILNSDQAARIGLVDELTDNPDAAVERALDWCRRHSTLPRSAMLMTRAMARADLHSLFGDHSALGVEKFVEVWFSETTQQKLRALAASLKKS